MRKIVVVTSYPFEDTNAAKARIEAFLKVLGETSEVLLLCRRLGIGVDAPENVIEVSTFDIPSNNFILRGISELFFSVRLIWRLWRIRPDAAIVTVPSMFLLLAGQIKKFPVVFDVRDLVWNYLPDKGITNKIAKLGLSKFAYSMLNRAAAILVTNEAEEKVIRGRVHGSIDIKVVSNGISSWRFDTITGYQMGHAVSYKTGNVNVLYIGNIGLAQDLSTMVEVASILRDMKFTIIGKGSDLRRISHLVASLGLINVHLVDGVPWNSLLEYYSHADVLYAQVVDGYDSAIPSKLYEYLAVGIPIIYAGTGASKRFISRFSGVACIRPRDEKELMTALDSVAELKCNIDVEGNRRIIREKYVRERQARIVNDVLDKLVGTQGPFESGCV